MGRQQAVPSDLSLPRSALWMPADEMKDESDQRDN